MKFVVDMNLGPDWVAHLSGSGHDVVHWSSVGDPRAKDADIVAWARTRDAVILTADLDFAAILALTGARGPSVVLVRVQDTFPSAIGSLVEAQIAAHSDAIAAGAIVTIDVAGARVRVLPIRSR